MAVSSYRASTLPVSDAIFARCAVQPSVRFLRRITYGAIEAHANEAGSLSEVDRGPRRSSCLEIHTSEEVPSDRRFVIQPLIGVAKDGGLAQKLRRCPVMHRTSFQHASKISVHRSLVSVVDNTRLPIKVVGNHNQHVVHRRIDFADTAQLAVDERDCFVEPVSGFLCLED